MADWGEDAKMAGYVIDDPKKPDLKGRVVLVDCKTGSSTIATKYAEIANVSAIVNRPKKRGSLAGTSIYSIPDEPPREIGQCKWTFRLSSIEDPGITACP